MWLASSTKPECEGGDPKKTRKNDEHKHTHTHTHKEKEK
jgi:hypothetical protein